MEKMALLVAAVIFLVVAILHLVRFFLKIEVKVGKVKLPLWLSVVGFIVAISLSLWMFTIIR